MRFGLSMPENVIDRAIENEDGLIGTFLPRRQRGPPNDLNLLVVPAAVDVNARADTGIVNSVPAALGQSKGLHGGEDETPITTIPLFSVGSARQMNYLKGVQGINTTASKSPALSRKQNDPRCFAGNSP